MQETFDHYVRRIFDSAVNAAELATVSSQTHGPNDQNKDLRGHADIVLLNASERLLAALGDITQITQTKTGLWVVGDFTRRADDSPLYVKEAAVDAALSVFTEGIDESDGSFRAPSWVE